MKTKQLLYMLMGLVVVVAAMVLAGKMASREPAKSDTLLYPTLDSAEIAWIDIAEKDSLVELRKAGDKWVLPAFDNYKADTAKMNKALTTILELEKKDLVSTNQEKQAKFEVDSSKGLRVTVKDADSALLADFWIGKSGADYKSHYIRKEGSSKVHTSTKSVRWEFRTGKKDWRDRTVWSLSQETIQSVGIVYDTVNVGFEQSTVSPWMLTRPQSTPADTAKVNAFLKQLCELTTDEWASKDDKSRESAFAKATVEVTVKQGNGSEHTLTVGDKVENHFYVKVNGDPTVFKLSEYKINNLKKNFAHFKAPEPKPEPVQKDSAKAEKDEHAGHDHD